MKKTGFALALAAMLVVPAGAVAKPTKADTKAASKECHALQEGAVSKANFQALGFKNFGDCVSKKSREEAAERRAAKREARAECKGVRGKARSSCIRGEARAAKKAMDRQDRNRVNAASECYDEQQDETQGGPEGFKERWGTEKANYKNAFGKCVSATAKAKNNEQETENGETESA